LLNNVKISGLVLTHNSEDTIEACLNSLKWVDEIIVIDDESADRTVEIVNSFGKHVKVFNRKLDDFSSQRNFGLEKCANDWVLVLDSDEQISDELQMEIKSVLSQPVIETGFQIPRKNFFIGTWIRSIYPDYCLRLFRRTEASYRGAVHESLNINGEIGKLTQPILHVSYRNIEEIIQKTNHYTSLAARELYKKGKKATLPDITIRPLLTFLKKYLLKRGFLDGVPGLILHLISGYYTFIKYAKLYFLRESAQKPVIPPKKMKG